MPRCVFREQPPPLLRAEFVEARVVAEEVARSFYGGLAEVIAVYPSLEDALTILSQALGGFKPLTSLPRILSRFANGGNAWLAANPTPTGEQLDCETICSHEPVVVYEGGRVPLHTPTALACDCLVYSVASLRDYGFEATTAWIAGFEGGVSPSSRVPGARNLAKAAAIVSRLWARGLAALHMTTERLEAVGPFAAFTRERLPILGEARDATCYGLRGFYAYSLYMEPGCYTPVGQGHGSQTDARGVKGVEEA